MVPHIPAIRRISTSPLVIYYWTENQILLTNAASELNTAISIDASGSLVIRPVIDGENKSSHVFSYVVVFKYNGNIYPIGQMLSDSHDVITIMNSLITWIQSGVSIPKEVVLDCSAALLIAICFAFNQCFLDAYLDKCFGILIQKQDNLNSSAYCLPPCFIRRDRNHLMSTVGKWEGFKKSNNGFKKDFYMRSIAYCLEIENMDELEFVIESIFIIAKSDNMGIEYDYRMKKMEEQIGSFDHEKYNSEKDANDDDTKFFEKFEELETSKHTKIYNYIVSLYNNTSLNRSDRPGAPNNY